MCKKLFLNEDQITSKDYNFIFSNIILSQRQKFTYDDIINQLQNMFTKITPEMENSIKNCLIRLRDDGFLTVLGSNYSVINIVI